ncbi:MAG: iron-containing alcohol dehydrogenase [Planctomycetaceae bacterium]
MPSAASFAMPAYDLVAPSLVVFGAGRLAELGQVVARFGRTAWLVSGGSGIEACGGRDAVGAVLLDAGVTSAWIATSRGEPTVGDVAAAVRTLPQAPHDVVVVAIGGGSAIDLAKAVAALAKNVAATADVDEQVVIDHLEGVGRGLPIAVPPLPVVAVPTTAGTGAEATRNAVISCPRRRFKKSMRSPLMVPRAAVIDPALTVSCPPGVTAATGLDAITQLVESFVCRFAAPLPRALVVEALPRAVAALPRVLASPADLAARAALSHAAFVSGVALTNSGLGMAHGVAAALGIECGTPHGVACGLMLPAAVATNRPACRDDFALLERALDPGAPPDAGAAADAFVRRIEMVCAASGIPRRLSDVGLDRGRLPWLAENSGGASMRGNPVTLEPGGLLAVLERLW